MTDRRTRMSRLFATLAEQGRQGEDKEVRRSWATAMLGRQVDSFSMLTIAEIDALIWILQYGDDPEASTPSVAEYVMCGEIGPDDLPCVLDVSHLDQSRPCVDEFGREWVLR